MNRGKAKRERKAQARLERLGAERGQREAMAWFRNVRRPSRGARRNPANRVQLELEAAKEYQDRNPRVLLLPKDQE